MAGLLAGLCHCYPTRALKAKQVLSAPNGTYLSHISSLLCHTQGTRYAHGAGPTGESRYPYSTAGFRLGGRKDSHFLLK